MSPEGMPRPIRHLRRGDSRRSRTVLLIVLAGAALVPAVRTIHHAAAQAALWRTAAAGDAVGVERALRAGAEPDDKDSDGRTAVALAIGGGEGLPAHAEVVRNLVAAGADPGQQIWATPLLFYAVAGQCPPLVRDLLARGQSANARVGSRPLLSLAVEHDWAVRDRGPGAGGPPRCCLGLAHLLLAAGADANARDMPLKYNRTPLMVAASQGDVPAVAELLSRGADARARDAAGRTALQFAREKLSRLNRAGLADRDADWAWDREDDVAIVGLLRQAEARPAGLTTVARHALPRALWCGAGDEAPQTGRPTLDALP